MMTAMTLFAALRGKDGRSLARALIVLVLVNLFAGGLNSGAAADGIGTPFCSAGTATDTPDALHHHEPDCCLPGSTPFGLAHPASAPAAAPQTDIRRAEVPHTADGGPSGGGKIRATARGPPLVV